MNLTHAPVNLYKKSFKILLIVFTVALVLEFCASMLGHPIIEITINDTVITPTTPVQCLLFAGVTAFFAGGIANFFLTIKIIKEKIGLSHWPALAVVFMTLLFALELLISALLVIPNIIIFGLKGRIKNRAYEVEF